jgi:hypothetical protein
MRMIQIALGELIKITLRIDAWNNRQPKQNKRFAIKPHRFFFGASSHPRNTFSPYPTAAVLLAAFVQNVLPSGVSLTHPFCAQQLSKMLLQNRGVRAPAD